MSTFEGFSAAIRKEVPVPTSEVVGQLGKTRHIQGLNDVVGNKAESLTAGHYFALGRTLTDDTKNPGWREKFFPAAPEPGMAPDASPAKADVRADAKAAGPAAEPKAFNPKPSPFGTL